MRRGHLFLIAGDSPMGLRLPLDSITWRPPPPEPERSLFAVVGDLPPSPAIDAALADDPPPITALCVELRDGHAHVFLPPLHAAEHVLELIAVVEEAAATLELPVIVEGYMPPPDTRLQHFVVAPTRRYRGQHPSERGLGRPNGDDHRDVRGGSANRPRRREVRTRRNPHRNRRRQPPDAWRAHPR